MARNPQKTAARKKRYRERKKAEKYGPEAVGQDLRGRHGQHAKGATNPRWNAAGKMQTTQGYIALRVPIDHPHAWGSPDLKRFKYAYEHVLVMTEHLGRPLTPGEVVHHRNGDKTDNRLANLELTSSADHQRHHARATRRRNSLGRFI